MKLLNKKTIIAILLLLLSFNMYADRFEPKSDGGGISRGVGNDGSTNTGIARSVGNGTQIEGLSVENQKSLMGNESVDEVSGGLSLRYTDLYFPGNGNVDLRLDRVFCMTTKYIPEAYQIATNWSYDLPSIVQDPKSKEYHFSPSVGQSINIQKALSALVVGSLDKSIKVDNAVIVANNIIPKSTNPTVIIKTNGENIVTSKPDYYVGSRTIYFPKSKSTVNIGHLKLSNSLKVLEVDNISITYPDGIVYVLKSFDKTQVITNFKRWHGQDKDTRQHNNKEFLVSSISHYYNRINFNYSETFSYLSHIYGCKGTYWDDTWNTNCNIPYYKNTDETTYFKLDSIIDSKNRNFTFLYMKKRVMDSRWEDYHTDKPNYSVYQCELLNSGVLSKSTLSNINYNDSNYISYSIIGNELCSIKDGFAYSIDLESVKRGSDLLNKEIKYNYEHKKYDKDGKKYYYPSKIGIVYPYGGSSEYTLNHDAQVTKCIIEEQDNISETTENSRISSYKYSTDVKTESDYLATGYKYGKTEIFTGYYKNNNVINSSKKDVYHTYEGTGDDKKTKGVVLSLTSEFSHRDSNNKDIYIPKTITQNELKKICSNYYLPTESTSYTGKGKKKGVQTITYDIYGNATNINSIVKKVEDENINQSELNTQVKYLYQESTNSSIWTTSKEYNDSLAKNDNSQITSNPIDLILNSYQEDAIASNSIILTSGFYTNSQPFHARLASLNYGTSNNTTHSPTPLSFNVVTESKISDKNNQYRLVKYNYDENLNKTKKTIYRLVDGRTSELTTHYEYDTYNNLTKRIDAEGNITEYKTTYITEGSFPWTNPLTGVTYPGTLIYKGETKEIIVNTNTSTITNFNKYDDRGRLTEEKVVDSLLTSGDQLHPVSYTYDDLDRLKSVTQNNEIVKQVYYERAGQNTIEVYDTVGNYSLKRYDGLNRLITEDSAITRNPGVVNPGFDTNLFNSIINSSISVKYHPIHTTKAINKIVYDTTSNGGVLNRTPKLSIDTEYDYAGREKTVKKNNIITSKIYYHDENSFIITTDYLTTDPIPDRYVSYTQHNLDWNGNIVKIKQAKKKHEKLIEDDIKNGTNLVVTKYNYDSFGNNTSMLLAYDDQSKTQTYTYKYDNIGQILETIYPEGTSEKQEYNKLGQVTTSWDRAGNMLITRYNNYNLPKTTTYYDASGLEQNSDHFTYNALRKPLSITQKDLNGNIINDYTYTYNQYGYLTNENISLNSGIKTYSMNSTYDKLGVVNKSTFTTGSYSREMNYVQPYSNPGSSSENKSIIRDSLGNNIATYNYSNWGALENILYGSNITTTYSDLDSLLRPQSITSINQSGNSLLQLNYTYDISGNVITYHDGTNTNIYKYDGLNRLITENNFTYSYDSLNNRISLKDSSNSLNDTTYNYDISLNKMLIDSLDSNTNADDTSYVYDLNGNLITKKQGSTTWSYTYNTQNQLIQVDSNNSADPIAIYKYDSFGHRVYKLENNIETYYIYDGNNIIYEESNEVSTPSVISNRIFNVIYNQNNIAKYINDDLQFHLLDNLGSRKLTTDSTGTPINESNLNYSAFGGLLSGNSDNYNFTGKQLDANTGLVYFNARYYDPVIGRFITEDPVKDGLNWYIFCDNNPLRFIDPDGLMSQEQYDSAKGRAELYGSSGAVEDFEKKYNRTLDNNKNINRWDGSIYWNRNGQMNPLLMNQQFFSNTFAHKEVGLKTDINLLKILAGKSIIPSIQYLVSDIAKLIRRSQCFTSGTLISTQDGYTKIEDIKEGDLVLSKNDLTGELAYKKVTNIFISKGNDLIKLKADNVIITTTPEHPFWATGKGWILAKNLKENDYLVNSHGNSIKILETEKVKVESSKKLYNFEVEDWHTYFVSKENIWVHNTCDPRNIKKISNKIMKDGKINLDKFKGNNRSFKKWKIEKENAGVGHGGTTLKLKNENINGYWSLGPEGEIVRWKSF